MSGDKLPIVERLEVASGRAFPSEPKTANEELCAEAATTITELVSALEGMLRIVLPVEMGLAQAECVDEPVPDDKTVLSFMGSGASDRVTAGEYRAAVSDARATLSTVRGETK